MQDVTSEFADVLEGASSDNSDNDDEGAAPPGKQPTPAFGLSAPTAFAGEQQMPVLNPSNPRPANVKPIQHSDFVNSDESCKAAHPGIWTQCAGPPCWRATNAKPKYRQPHAVSWSVICQAGF